MENEQLIIIARNYKWNQDNMQNWFTEQDRLKFQLGLEFDTRLRRPNPHIDSSLP